MQYAGVSPVRARIVQLCELVLECYDYFDAHGSMFDASDLHLQGSKVNH